MSPDGAASHPPATVLVVDDYPAVLAWATRAFERAGWRVLTATDAESASGRWSEASDAGVPVALLVTDVALPGVDGVALALALRERDPRLPIVALHAGASPVTDWPTALLDRSAFFEKPVRAADLLATAAALMTTRDADDSSAGDERCPHG